MDGRLPRECRNLIKKLWAFIKVPYTNPAILGYMPRVSESGSYITPPGPRKISEAKP